MSLALFFFALAPSFYAMYISWEGGEIMPPFGWEWLEVTILICSFVCVGIGLLFAIVSIVLGLIWFIAPPLPDPVTIELRKIKTSVIQIEQIAADVAQMKKMMGTMKDSAEDTKQIDHVKEEGNQLNQTTSLGSRKV
jgi:hypothetical protein